MKNSKKTEKSLKNWKLPPSSSTYVFGRKNGFSCIPDCKIKTVEKTIFLPPGYSTFPLFSECHKRAIKICNNYIQVGMIQVALKPTKLGSNTCSSIYLRDKRFGDGGYDSLLGMVVSSLCDGPVYFTYYPNRPIMLSDPREAFTIDVKIQGGESITLMYKFHYKLKKKISHLDSLSGFRNDKKGETTYFIARVAQGNRVVSKKTCWNKAENSESIVWSTEEAPSYDHSGTVGSAKIDWKETADAHVLKVDVPGFKKEEVRVEVEDGRILEISGERSNEEEEEIDHQWHCEERSSGKFLRRLNMPENANLDELKAAMENGVLTVTVPKEEFDKNPKVKKVVVDISG